jgi:hypothetical protein
MMPTSIFPEQKTPLSKLAGLRAARSSGREFGTIRTVAS